MRICWCFTFSFHTSVEYVFAGKSQAHAMVAASAGPDPYAVAADEYVALFE